MAQANVKYDDNSIKSLKNEERVREKPSVIFGSDGLEGCQHSIFEILSNSVDEAREGYGKVIRTTVFSDKSIEIEDDGRGVPMGYNEREKRYNWDLIYCDLYAGGKYENNENGSYMYSLGTNGLGAAATQYASEYMQVRSYNGETLSEMNFKKGKPSGKLKVRELDKKDKKHGTIVKWKPDLEVFTSIDVQLDFLTDTLKKQAIVNSGIRFILNWQKEDGKFDTYDYYYENGILDYLTELSGDNTLTQPVKWSYEDEGRDREDKNDYKLKVEMAFCVSNSAKALEYFHNSSYLEHGGSPDKAVKTAFLYELDKFIRASGKYNKNESKITFVDIEDCLVFISNSFSTQTSYANQTKKAISNTFIAESMTSFIKRNLEVYFKERPIEAEKFANQVLINKRSRENAEKMRIDVKKKLSGKMDLTNRVEKFVGCRSRDENKRELYIVEGDSALSSCKLARDAEFQAIMPVRGKTLNCLKSTYDKIFKNQIIVDLLKVIGCGVELDGKVKSELSHFDLDSLTWAKIIICTDADVDGYQIRTLLLTLFYRLLPTLIKEGRIYIAESPLFEISCGDDIYFAYNEEEKTEILSKLGNRKYSIQRSKGLGENQPDMMRQTTMLPQTRRLIKVEAADAEKTARIFDTLLGDDLAGRKEFISAFGADYVSLADI